MRICFITVGDTGRRTGGYLYHREVFARLRAAGATVEEIVAAEAPPDAQLAAAAGLGARVNLRHYDCIMVDALARAVAAPWLDTWRARRPLVALVHELPSVAAGPGAAEEELVWEAPLLRADWLVAVSRHGADILAGRGAPRERIVVASGGHDRLAGHAAPAAPRAPGAGARALCVAQWIPRKGLLELLRAWAEAASPADRLELIGETAADPAYAAELRAAIAAAGPDVLERGAVSDDELRAAYAAADIFALPSHYEGYGIAFAEALSYGLPVLACAVGPLPELLGDAAALLVPPGDGPALAAALGRLLADDALRARMGAAALARAHTLPTWDDTAGLLLNALGAAVVGRMGGAS